MRGEGTNIKNQPKCEKPRDSQQKALRYVRGKILETAILLQLLKDQIKLMKIQHNIWLILELISSVLLCYVLWCIISSGRVFKINFVKLQTENERQKSHLFFSYCYTFFIVRFHFVKCILFNKIHVKLINYVPSFPDLNPLF